MGELVADAEPVWSDWVPFAAALEHAPREPGVCMAREGADGPVVYIGMAGERRGSRNRPQGLRGRLAIYTSGKGLASGLGEAVFDRALADPEWLRARLAEVEAGQPRRAKAWGAEAFARADLHIRWTVTADKEAARALETRLVADGDPNTLWNRAGVTSGSRPLPAPATAGRVRLGGFLTQPITDSDAAAGIIRIPVGDAKTLFPAVPCRIDVVV